MNDVGAWRLQLFGRPKLSFEGAPVAGLPKKAYLSAARLISLDDGLYESRESLAAFLWPGADPDRRRASLRTLIKRIRAAMRGRQAPLFRIDEQGIALVPDALACDLIALNSRLARGEPGDIVEAARLTESELLQDCDAGPPERRRWLASERQRLAHTFARVASKAMKNGAFRAEPRLREEIELKILAARPLHEGAQNALAKVLRGRGGSAMAKGLGGGSPPDAVHASASDRGAPRRRRRPLERETPFGRS